MADDPVCARAFDDPGRFDRVGGGAAPGVTKWCDVIDIYGEAHVMLSRAGACHPERSEGSCRSTEKILRSLRSLRMTHYNLFLMINCNRSGLREMTFTSGGAVIPGTTVPAESSTRLRNSMVA